MCCSRDYDIMWEKIKSDQIFNDTIRDMTLNDMILTKLLSTRSTENGFGFDIFMIIKWVILLCGMILSGPHYNTGIHSRCNVVWILSLPSDIY